MLAPRRNSNRRAGASGTGSASRSGLVGSHCLRVDSSALLPVARTDAPGLHLPKAVVLEEFLDIVESADEEAVVDTAALAAQTER